LTKKKFWELLHKFWRLL